MVAVRLESRLPRVSELAGASHPAVGDLERRRLAGGLRAVLFERGPSVAATEAVQSEHRAGPVLQRVSAERAGHVAVGVGVDLGGENDG